MHLWRLATSFLFLGSVYCGLTEEYYEQLIEQRSAESLTYVPPQGNEEFRAGIQSNTTQDFGGEYDFVIVGAGSCGSVLATRLSEVDNFRILLLEAGGDEDDYNIIPAMMNNIQFSDINWGYYTTPQKNCCLGMTNQECIVPRGKVIGGSSATNAMMYVRGNPRDYDNWARLGNRGWSYREVKPYFIKSENSQIDGDVGYHGKGGLWNVEYSSPNSPFFTNFAEGSLALKRPDVDYNGRNQFGFSRIQFTTKYGRRQSTGTAFLPFARKRKNLVVLTKAFVTKINIDPTTKIAQGVEFVNKNQKFTVKATREVLLSGGAINSPQVLILSGIGPKAHLNDLGIKVIADLPVGQNLREHPLFPGLAFHTNFTASATSTNQSIEEYLNGFGPLTRAAGVNGIGFTQTGNKSAQNYPTIEYLLTHANSGNNTLLLQKSYNYNDNLTNNFLSKINPPTDFSIFLVLLHEKSRGQVTLKSNSSLDFPNIDLNMLSKQEDVDTLIDGINFILQLLKTDAFKRINATLIDNNIPICNKFTKYSNQYWKCVLQQMTTTIYHPCGTTAMGPNRRKAVVDKNLRVYGIKNLRVVDVGVFPTTVSGHTNAPAVMVAEKISDAIKRDYGY